MNPTKLKIVTDHEGQVLVKKWKNEGLTVVFTNGCFDIIHLGHIDYLEKARNLGDKLIVGVNSDRSIKILKGDSRPVNNQESRLRMMAAFDFVDAVILFDQETPKEVIEKLVPDVLVKGKDYEISNIVGADIVMKNGGRVETINLVEGFSTTQLIEKIKNL